MINIKKLSIINLINKDNEKNYMNPNKKDILNKLITKKDNLLIVKFSEFTNTKKTLEILDKIRFHNKLTPLDIKSKIEKLLQNDDSKDTFNFNEILEYLQKENLWSEVDSIEFQIKRLLNKSYGYNKIYEKLKSLLYNEDLITKKLNEITINRWIEIGKTILNKIIKKQNIDDKLKHKIFKKLQYEGFRDEEINEILKSI